MSLLTFQIIQFLTDILNSIETTHFSYNNYTLYKRIGDDTKFDIGIY